MNLVDVHAHLDWKELSEDIDSVVDEARKAGVKVIITNGVGVESNRKVLGLSSKHDIVKPALGIYPNDSLNLSDEEFQEELRFIESVKPFAIGEVGLDYKEEVDKEKMKERFREQVNLAKKLDIPVLVHSRKAEEDVVKILEETGHKKIVMHCFGGKKRLVKRVIENGWSFSIPAIIVRLQHFQGIVEKTPLAQLLTETDAPFLSPYGDFPCKPSYVVESLNKIAEIKGLTPEETANQIFMNYQKMFL